MSALWKKKQSKNSSICCLPFDIWEMVVTFTVVQGNGFPSLANASLLHPSGEDEARMRFFIEESNA